MSNRIFDWTKGQHTEILDSDRVFAACNRVMGNRTPQKTQSRMTHRSIGLCARSISFDYVPREQAAKMRSRRKRRKKRGISGEGERESDQRGRETCRKERGK